MHHSSAVCRRSTSDTPRSRRPKAMLSITVSHGNRVYDWNTIPRSAPGRVTGSPSSRTRPSLARSRPATIRSKVDLPQPDGPKMAMKSLSATHSERGSRARDDPLPPRTAGKVRVTPSMMSLLMDPCAYQESGRGCRRVGIPSRACPTMWPPNTSRPVASLYLPHKRAGGTVRQSPQTPGEERAVDALEQEIGGKSYQADDNDAKNDLPRGEQRLAVGDHVTDSGRWADQLGDDDVGPSPAQHQTEDLRNLRWAGGDQHARDDPPIAGAQCVGCFHQIAPGVAHADSHHQDQLEHRANEYDEQLLGL